MPRKKLFDLPISDINIKLPRDKAEQLRSIARANGLALTDYIRSLVYTHLARVKNSTDSKS